MSRRNTDSDFEGLLLVGFALWLYDKYTVSVVPALEKAGADVYEKLHPSERDHANDLPQHALSKAQLLDLATRTGFPDPKLAVAIALAESGGVPNALGDMRDGKFLSIGLWQINTRAWPGYTREYLSDPGKNALAAFAISKHGTDWRPWSTWWKYPARREGPGQGRFTRFL